jgi:proteasome accessory factor A
VRKNRTIVNPSTADDLWPPRVLKVCGADIELGNFYLGASPAQSPGRAARALLSRIDGVSARPAMTFSGCTCEMCVARRQGAAPDPQDSERRFLSENGGCAYIDLDHLELCLPEVRSAFDHVACWHAMLRLARRALVSVNAAAKDGSRVQALVNNRDGRGNSYGSHLDFLVTRRAWDNIFRRRMHYLLHLAAYQVSSIVITGQGKVGSENGPSAAFQLSQRADFIETLTGPQTTFNRPIVNSRDEALAGAGLARLHAIFFDSTLCHVASLLKVGMTQIVLAMIEAERVNADLVLDDPLEALGAWSRDPSLKQRAPLASGRQVTAVELQRLFFESAAAFAASGELEPVVPRAGEILALWDDTLRKLEARDYAALAPRLDWVLKLSMLERYSRQHPEVDWDAPQVRHLDHAYASLDEQDGLYWSCEAGGAVERVVTEAEILRFTTEPPDDTRAWTRTMLMRALGKDGIDRMDWDSMDVRIRDGRPLVPRRVTMAHPARLGRLEAGPWFESAATLADTLDALDAREQIDTRRAEAWNRPPVYVEEARP